MSKGTSIQEKNIDVTKYSHLYDSKYSIPEVNISIHHLPSNNIVIIYPGAGGSKDGYEDKYVKMADLLIQNNVGAVIRTDNVFQLGNGWTTTLEITIEYALDHSEEICERSKPNIYLIGHSIGAGACDLISCVYKEIKKILLTSPAPIMKNNEPQHGIGEYAGEVYVVIGDEDQIPREYALQFYELAEKASKRELEIIKGCGHHFEGKENFERFVRLPVECFGEN